MKTKFFFTVLLFVLIVLNLAAQDIPLTIILEKKSEMSPRKLLIRQNNYKISLVNRTGESLFIKACTKDLTLMNNDTLEIRFDYLHYSMKIITEAGINCEPSVLQYYFSKDSLTHDLWILDTTESRTAMPEPSMNAEKNQGNMFIPSPEAENKMAKNINIEGNQYGQSHVQYILYCNINGGDIRYRRIGFENKKLKRIHPTIGKDFQVIIENYNPYRDSIVLGYQFEDKNLELGEKFSSLMGSFMQSGTGASTADKTGKAGIQAEAQSTDEISIPTLSAFSHEMQSFYNEKYQSPSLDLNYLSACINIINQRMCDIFKAPYCEADSIYNFVKRKINAIPSASDRTLYLQYFETGFSYYRKIITYKIAQNFPIQVENSDEMQIQLKQYRDKQLQDSRKYHFYTKGGFKIDFSAGIMGSNLIDYNYTTQVVSTTDTLFYYRNYHKTDSIIRIDTVNKNRIIRDNQGNFTVGIGLLAHFYFRTGNYVNFAVNTGFMIDNNIATRYLFGGSLILGHHSRFILNAGGIVGKVKRLASGLEEGQFYDAGSGQVQTIPTKDVWNFGFYVGITYNFASISPKSNKTKE